MGGNHRDSLNVSLLDRNAIFLSCFDLKHALRKQLQCRPAFQHHQDESDGYSLDVFLKSNIGFDAWPSAQGSIDP